ncbi:ATP-binding protein [Actinoplanes sp. URMC 104]|uniref:ATP-binding protein n=1 Tax=Actinoplanes sp. URMC 104 TaxID=3423409 RepID=UPI003F1D0ED9
MTGWKVWRPPPVEERIATWTIDEPPGLQPLREALQRSLLGREDLTGIDADDLAERLVLVATELAGNALRHSSPPTVVALLRSDGHLILDVADSDPLSAPVVEHRAAGAGGLGLQLTERLAHEVGWYPDNDGKHVWALFSITP